MLHKLIAVELKAKPIIVSIDDHHDWQGFIEAVVGARFPSVEFVFLTSVPEVVAFIKKGSLADPNLICVLMDYDLKGHQNGRDLTTLMIEQRPELKILANSGDPCSNEEIIAAGGWGRTNKKLFLIQEYLDSIVGRQPA